MGKLKKNEKWHTERQKQELISEIKCENVKQRGLDTKGNKEKGTWKIKLRAKFKYLMRMLYIRIHKLQKI